MATKWTVGNNVTFEDGFLLTPDITDTLDEIARVVDQGNQ